jgi:hypothetical protein
VRWRTGGTASWLFLIAPEVLLEVYMVECAGVLRSVLDAYNQHDWVAIADGEWRPTESR